MIDRFFVFITERTFAKRLIVEIFRAQVDDRTRLSSPSLSLFHAGRDKLPFAAARYPFHEQVRQTDTVEHVMRTHPLVTVVELQVEEGENVFVEDVQYTAIAPLRVPSWSTLTAVLFSWRIQGITPELVFL